MTVRTRIGLLALAGAVLVGVLLGHFASGADESKARAQQATSRPGLRMAPRDLAVFQGAKSGRKLPSIAHDAAVETDDGKPYLMLNVEFETPEACQAFKLDGTQVLTRVERFADVYAPMGQDMSTKVEKLPGVRWVEIADTDIAPPPARPTLSKEATRQIAEPIVQGGFDGLSGKGVLLAIVDSGVDFHHPDFIEYDADGKPHSRIKYFWDTTSEAYANGHGKPAPVKYPSGAAIGTIFSQEDLNKELQGSRFLMSEWDTCGHGTACAGIAAGNGNQSGGKYKGVAPKADIIAVRLEDGGQLRLMNTYLLGTICEWLDSVAGPTPLVISCSWGGRHGGCDGQSIVERELEARFPMTRKGRAVLFSAGNDGTEKVHAAIDIKDNDHPGNLRWKSSEGDVYLEIYVQTDKLSDLWLGALDDTTIDYRESYVNPITGQAVFEILSSGSKGGVFLYSQSGAQYAADAFIRGGEFDEQTSQQGQLLSAPGTCVNVITVGSYDWNDQFTKHGRDQTLLDSGKPLKIGGLSSYSSTGPLRIGSAVKPDLVAPGQYYCAPAPVNVLPFDMREDTGFYQLFNGTSAATPYVAGLVALVFERKPDITLGELREALHKATTHDTYTGDVPNPSWGYGKMDQAAVKRLLDAVKTQRAPR